MNVLIFLFYLKVVQKQHRRCFKKTSRQIISWVGEVTSCSTPSAKLTSFWQRRAWCGSCHAVRTLASKHISLRMIQDLPAMMQKQGWNLSPSQLLDYFSACEGFTGVTSPHNSSYTNAFQQRGIKPKRFHYVMQRVSAGGLKARVFFSKEPAGFHLHS